MRHWNFLRITRVPLTRGRSCGRSTASVAGIRNDALGGALLGQLTPAKAGVGEEPAAALLHLA